MIFPSKNINILLIKTHHSKTEKLMNFCVYTQNTDINIHISYVSGTTKKKSI